MKSKGLDDTLSMHRIIYICTFCAWSKALFCLTRSIYGAAQNYLRYNERKWTLSHMIRALFTRTIQTHCIDPDFTYHKIWTTAHPTGEQEIAASIPAGSGNIISIMKRRLFKYIDSFTSKNRKFSGKKFWYFFKFLLKTDCVYSLEPRRRGGSNECPQSMFWAEIRKLMYTPVNPSFTTLKWGLRGSKLYGHVFVMVEIDFKIFISPFRWFKKGTVFFPAYKAWNYAHSKGNRSKLCLFRADPFQRRGQS